MTGVATAAWRRGTAPAPLAAVLAAALLGGGPVVAACADPEEEAGEMPELDSVYYDDAALRARERADAVAEVLGHPLEDPYLSVPPCEDPAGNPSRTGVYYLHSSYTLTVGADGVADTLRAAYDYFVRQGFHVDDIRWFDDGSGDLSAREPDGFTYSLLSTEPPVALSFWVDSPCYQAPDDEVPGDQWLPPSGSPSAPADDSG